MTGFKTLQRDFRAALLDPDAPPPAAIRARPGDDPARGFAVYRNNVAVSLIDALAERFPVVQRLVGEDFFRAMAGLYVRAEPPATPLLMEYGETFADFIAAFPPAAELPYLSDVARLEAARTRAWHAADAMPLDPERFANLDPAGLGGMTAALHPSVTVLRSPWAVARIWAAHGSGSDDDLVELDPEGPEDVLVARPDMTVEVRTLPPGAASLIHALAEGASFAVSAADVRDTDLSEALAAVIRVRIVSALDPGT